MVIDPFVIERAERALAEAERIETERLNGSTESDDALSEEDEELLELPDPTIYYEVDGTVKLVRTRFLHLEFDLEMRAPVYDPLEMEEVVETVLSDGSVMEPGPPRPTSFLIHELKQSRQVRTERMEYFDSPVLGVLAYVTLVDYEALKAEQEEAVE